MANPADLTHGHFTSSWWDGVGRTDHMMQQNQLDRDLALGNHRTLTQRMAIEPAMSLYLSNALNVRGEPNQNFARELMELFLLALAGRGGIPASGASAVLLNVTAVAPTAGTFVTVFPSGVARPLAANLNAVAGQVVPNMVLARLGSDGAVVLYNNGGTVDLVADVMGYFTA